MKRILPLGCLLAALFSPPVSVILDLNDNTMSDVWERTQNSGDLYTDMIPGEDDDSDGWTNEEESVAGTNPKSSLVPDGFLRPEINIIHDVPFDFDEDEFAEANADVATIAWPIIAGKIYTLLHCTNLVDGSWAEVTKNISEATGIRTCHALVTRTDGVPPTDPKMFWRIKIEDVDSDGDGLTDAEEHELDTNPILVDTDGDGLDDYDEVLVGTNPNIVDTDGDGSSDGYEVNSGNDPHSNQSYPPTWVYTQRYSFHGLPYIQSSSIWDNYYCVTHNWDPTISAPETCAGFLASDCPFPTQPPDNNSHFAYVNGYAPHLVESSGNRPHPGYCTHLTQSRFWLKTKPAPVADIKCTVLRVTQRKILGANYSIINLAPLIEPTDVLIHAGEIFSDPIDALPTFTQALQNDDQEHVITTIVPVDITVVFGIGPSAPAMPGAPGTSRDMLESYLDTVKVARTGNFWLVSGKNTAGADQLYCIEIADTEEKLLSALGTAGMTVVFDGHANFGLGPNFSIASFKSIADFTNFGVNHTDIPQRFRGNGNEPDPMPYYGSNGQPLPADPVIAAPLMVGVSHLNEEGWGYLTLQPNDVMGTVANYIVPGVGGLRYENNEGINNNQSFSKQGQGFNNEWHFTQGVADEKRLIVTTPANQVPQLRYGAFFYNACETGVHFIENFQHGNFIYTKRLCPVLKATKFFVKNLVEGKTPEQATLLLDGEDNADDLDTIKTYDIKTF